MCCKVGHKCVISQVFFHGLIKLFFHFLVASDEVFEGSLTELEIFCLLVFEILPDLSEDRFNDGGVILDSCHF
jgi:hypothetical protein